MPAERANEGLLTEGERDEYEASISAARQWIPPCGSSSGGGRNRATAGSPITLSTSWLSNTAGPAIRINLALACHRCNLRKGPNLTGIDP